MRGFVHYPESLQALSEEEVDWTGWDVSPNRLDEPAHDALYLTVDRGRHDASSREGGLELIRGQSPDRGERQRAAAGDVERPVDRPTATRLAEVDREQPIRRHGSRGRPR